MSNVKLFSDILQDWTEAFTRRSMRDYKHFLDESGLSPSQLGTLMRLHFGGMCGVSDVGEHIGISNAAASQMVDRMVQMGLLKRAESPDDRRAKQLTLTDNGHAVIQHAIDARRCWMEDLTRALTPDEQTMISAALVVLTEAAHQLEAVER